jgi:S1-C subfamily serine protease
VSKKLQTLAAAMAVAAIATAGGARAAEEWAPSAHAEGVSYETEVTTVARTGELVRSLTRATFDRTQRDETTHRGFIVEYQERFDDCAHHRFQMGSYERRDAQDKLIASGSTLRMGWQEVHPGSVAEGLSRIACAVANPPAEPPIQEDLRDGSWTDLGASADGKFHLQVRIDGVRKISERAVVAVSRSVYEQPEWIEGFPARYIVTAGAIDCAEGASASLGADLYITPTVRVRSVRVPGEKLEFKAAGPKSFLARSMELICAAGARPEGEEAAGLSVGTAWGVNKGYLVTASHVIEGGRKIEVYRNGEKLGEASVVADDPANDLALLKYKPARPGRITVLPIAERTASLGRSVFTLGYPAPDALGQHVKMTAGQVSSTAGYQDDARFLQISVPIQQGNSGGPIIGWDGSVVGVVEAKLVKFDDGDEGPAPEMVNYALKAAYIRPMLDGLPDLGNYVMIKPVADHEQMVQAAGKAVFMVVVSP